MKIMELIKKLKSCPGKFRVFVEGSVGGFRDVAIRSENLVNV
jgi:microcompartment protein CcmL/EutN